MPTRPPQAADALPRFLALARALRESKRWFDDWTLLRHASVPLGLLDGDPTELAAALRETMDEFKRRARWWQETGGSLRILLAAQVLQSGGSVAERLAEFARAEKLFRAQKLPRGRTSEIIASAVLAEQAPDGRVTETQVRRVRAIFDWIKRDHSWTVGAGEYPTIALLAATAVEPERIGIRVERIFQDLKERGFKSRSAAISASHLLFFHPAEDPRACERFEALWHEFRARGLRMQSGDYDEIALLAFAPGTASSIASKVLEHRAAIIELRPKPDRNTSFSLACGTAFLELVGQDRALRRLSRIQATLQIQSVLRARQAAATAAAASAAT
ncbi:MAG: DUF4003 domain-containing protein [Planctomycetes bacterium]|nr:DUF4003 domain-containing protein [Planctomycetota bacterium]